ncbi:amino acid ABC transporter permease [Frankia nepalensis]|uniref:amino acid ABC transporter permease n=1 Tax=Frankia nepalensis TaxID=1836974 RepID=UPI0027DDCFAE|nr:amino acid ABC transporter permease [Frankia nepalensis]
MEPGPGPGSPSTETIKAVPVRHPGRWLTVAVLAVLVAMLANALVTNDAFDWGTVWEYLFTEQVLRGLWATLYLTVYAMAVGIVGGVLVAVLRLSPNPILRGVSWTYTWFFRGTPVMIQILFWANIGALYPELSIGIPFGPEFASAEANTLVPLLGAAVLGLGLNEAAYMAEIVRAGINAVDEGQVEAAHALGMGRALTLRRIVLPQAMRIIIPPTGNETISMLKTTSLVSVIAYTELLYAVQIVYSRNYRIIPLLLVAAIWYLAFTSILSVGQYYLERYYDPAGRNRLAAGRPTRRDQSGT